MAKTTKKDAEMDEAMVKIGVTEARAKEIAKELPKLFNGAKKTHEVIERICNDKKLNEAEKVVLAFMAGTVETKYYAEQQDKEHASNRNMYG